MLGHVENEERGAADRLNTFIPHQVHCQGNGVEIGGRVIHHPTPYFYSVPRAEHLNPAKACHIKHNLSGETDTIYCSVYELIVTHI